MKKKICLLLSTISLFLFCIFFLSEHYFKIETMEDHVFSSDISLMINGTKTETFPHKDSGLKVSNITCSEGIGFWDYEEWGLRIRNIKNTRVKCSIDFTRAYSESVLNGTDPVIKDNLVPVTLDNDGTVKKANLGTKWYNYNEKSWANAILLSDESIVYYDGETIPESNIESYFVWIPRYRYQLFNDGNYSNLSTAQNKSQEITLIFENKDIAASNGSSVGTYLTHPAFTSFDSNGMWVGKFETGYKKSTSMLSAQSNTNDSSKVQIKPNVYSWRGINVANAHLSSFNYQRNLNSHLLKNTEWGAIAYLSHSKYGSQSNLRMNNNSDFLTGFSGVSEPSCNTLINNLECNKYGTTNEITKPYNTDIGYLASTSGNISGIYDMSGGAIEYTLSVVKDTDGNPMSGTSEAYNGGFNGKLSNNLFFNKGINFPDAKYYDSYANHVGSTSFYRRILGDATGEMGPFFQIPLDSYFSTVSSWYQSESNFVVSGNVWMLRGGLYQHGTNAGLFTFATGSGHAIDRVSYRIVLTF